MTKKERELKETLDRLHGQWNRREYVSPDPLETLYDYDDPDDREVVGMIASSLAYGRVAQILLAISRVLTIMGPSPHQWLLAHDEAAIAKACDGYVYRFTRGEHLSALLTGMRVAILAHGSLRACFVQGYSPQDETLLPALSHYVKVIKGDRNLPGHLLSDPEGKSACKKSNLFLRWMVRHDDVDPGGWHQDLPASKLVIPVDTHMHAISKALKFTKRKAADQKTALEITKALARLCPEDPVKYDFTLTRFGIRDELNVSEIV